MTAGPTGGQPTGPADLREAQYQERLAAEARAEALAKSLPAKPTKSRKRELIGEPGPRALTSLLSLTDDPPKRRQPRAHTLPPAPVAPKPEPIVLVADTPWITEDGAPTTREAWMLLAVDVMRPWLDGTEVPPVRISFGWPGGRGSKKNVRGQCWFPEAVIDHLPAIFVSPDQENPLTILGIILHELIHASGARGHRGAFAKIARDLGFLAPWTSSENKTPELAARLAALADQLGPINHGRVNAGNGLFGVGPSRPPVQSTRMLKLTCPECGYTVRTTRKWIEVALPVCGVDGETLEEAS